MKHRLAGAEVGVESSGEQEAGRKRLVNREIAVRVRIGNGRPSVLGDRINQQARQTNRLVRRINHPATMVQVVLVNPRSFVTVTPLATVTGGVMRLPR